MTFKGTVKYTVSKTTKVLYFCQEINSRELLRPLIITTDAFGQKWTSTSNDVKQMVTVTSAKSCRHLMDSVLKQMNFAVVDIIGKSIV